MSSGKNNSLSISQKEAIEQAVRQLDGTPLEGEAVEEQDLDSLSRWIDRIHEMSKYDQRFVEIRRLANYILQHPHQAIPVMEQLAWESGRKTQNYFIRDLLYSRFVPATRVISQLSDQDRAHVTKAYGLDGNDPQSLTSINKDVSREMMRQNDEAALRKIVFSMILAQYGVQDALRRWNVMRKSAIVVSLQSARLDAVRKHYDLLMSVLHESDDASDGEIQAILEETFPMVGKESPQSSSPVQSEQPGGIDLNPNNLDLQTQGSRFDFKAPLDFIDFQNIRIDGFTPVIINVTPLTNLPLLLGLVEEREDDPRNVNYTPQLDPIDRKREDYLKVSSLN